MEMATELAPLPPTYATTRAELRRLACHVVSPARKAAAGRIGLTATPGGFGTPPFDDDRVVRVEGTSLVLDGARPARRPLTTLTVAAELAGVTLQEDPGVGSDVPPLGDPDAPLAVDADAVAAVAAWFAFCADVLGQLREELGATTTPSEITLWPEHFDIAFDADPGGGRANFGGSPGDDHLVEPYLYVGPREPRAGVYWNQSFGATLGYRDLLAGDARAIAVAFLQEGVGLLC